MEERKFTDQELVRRQKLQELKDLGIDPFGQRFDVTAYTSDIRKNYSGKTAEELEESKPAVSIAGRIVEVGEQYIVVQIATVKDQPVPLTMERVAIQRVLPKNTIKSF